MSIKKRPMFEFYSKLNEMKDLYENQGYRMAKQLYEKMQQKYDWKMQYTTFCIYFNKEIKDSKKRVRDEQITY